MKAQLRKRGYSGKSIERQLRKVDTLNREDLLKTKNQRKSGNDRVPIVLTYSHLLPDVHKIVRKHIDTLYQSDRMKLVFKQPPVVAYRRDRNLCDSLVHYKTHKLVGGYDYTCEPDCKFCKILTSDNVYDTDNHVQFHPTQDVHCRKYNLIYCILCNKCRCTVYVGQTQREIRERMREHLRDIRQQNDKPIIRHFDDNHTADNATFAILEQVYEDSVVARTVRESLWIKKLKTTRPMGCNVKDCWVPAQFRTL